MRIAFLILTFLHGIIHLAGFLKAFSFIEIKELTLSYSKPLGLFWLTTCILFLVFGIAFWKEQKYYWVIGIIAVFISQIVILLSWQDAKFGTIPNTIILMVCILGWFAFQFDRQIQHEISSIFKPSQENQKLLKEQDIRDLPRPVKNWLEQSGVIGNPMINYVHLKQEFSLLFKPGQKTWYQGEAEQYYNTHDPSFLWTIRMKMMNFIPIKGRDLFKDGKGEMLIKIASSFPVVNEMDNDKINQASLQRYLGEIVWFPTAAVSPYIVWEEIDHQSAKATMFWQGTSGTGTFHFHENGDIKKFSTLRFMGSDENADLKEWIIEVEKTEEMNGIRIPTLCRATWILDEGDWTWAKIKVNSIDYY